MGQREKKKKGRARNRYEKEEETRAGGKGEKGKRLLRKRQGETEEGRDDKEEEKWVD